MTCAGCGHENRAGRKFCTECGAALLRACAACGASYEGGEKFCGECGAALGASSARVAAPTSAAPATHPPSGGGERKVVTVIFADLAGSTALQERLDAESVQRLMARYYEALRAAVEAHGGTVVKLLGDGVMAAFGLRRVSEDDALRAVRAAVAMQDAFRALTGSQPALAAAGLRVGVNTGEVVVSGALDDVVGDPVNIAARLQEKARNGDVVVGEATRRLVATRVTLAPLGSVALKGRAEAVAAHRVESLEAPAGVTAAPFVGRDDELARLRAVFDAAGAAPAARLAVLLGSAGLGKSRLIDELGRRLGDAATLLVAHCDAAGGATFAPVVATLRRHLGIEDAAPPAAQRAAIDAVLAANDADRARVGGGIAALLAGSPASPEETFYVVRRFLAALAHTRPLVLVIDDLHWAEPLLLDLVEHLIQWGAGVPLFVLLGARPELRDLRSSLVVPGGLVSEVVTLGGLDSGAAMRLAAGVIGAVDLPAAVAAKVFATSEGNPLFVGELVRMLVQEGALTKEGDRWVASAGLAAIAMPPTIHALLAARIERLRFEERMVLERAAVVGRHFSRGAVAALLGSDGTELDARLESLRRSELIEGDSGWLLGEPILRFHHALIRDAAYRRLLKGTRAELHERLADWIEGQVGDAAEHDETVGWHLEQAHQHLRELGPLDAHAKVLGERAAVRLAAAGRRALARDDVPLAGGLLGRAIDRLEADAPARADLALDWCEALLSASDVAPAAAAIAELDRLAAESARLRGWHTCFAAQLAVMTAPEELRAAAERVATAARDLAAEGDAAGEAKAHFVHAQALARLGKVGACEAALDDALAAARRAGDRRRANAVLAGAPLAALSGPSPVTRASGRCLDVVRVLRITQGAPAVEAVALACQGILEALRGRSEAARRMLASSRTMVEELGITQRVYEVDAAIGRLDLLAGDAASAARRLRTAYEGLRDLGLGIDAARAAASLGRALLADGRAADAEQVSRESERLAGDDLQAAIAWRGVRAEALAARGEHAAAIELAAAAVAIATATDALLDHADARRALAAAYRAAGRYAEADAEARRAVELWEAKGATLLVEQARGAASADLAPAPPVAAQTERGRQVRPNAASRGQAAMDAAIAARDLAAIVALHSEAFTEIDHPNGATYGFDGATRSLHHLVQAENPWCRHEPLATLGDTLALCRRRLGAGGSGSARFDVGAYEDEKLSLLEVDDRGRALRQELFGPDRLAEAATRLFERYAASLPDGPDRTRAAVFAATAATVLGWNLTQLPPSDTLFVPEAEARDHRRIGLWSARGVAEIERHFRALDTVATNVVMSVEELLALEPGAMLFRRMHSGVDRGSGGRYEREFLFLTVGGADGRIARAEWFDVDQEVAALARFDELTRRAAPSARRRVRPNRATATDERSAAAIAAGDIATLEALFGATFEEIYHPTGSTYGRAASLASIGRLLRSEGASYRTEPIATLGDALALGRQRVHASGARGRRLDVGEYENEMLSLHEVDAQGRYLRHEVFASDRMNEAIVRLYARWAELLPDDGTRAPAAVTARVIAFLLTKEKAGDVDELCASAFQTVDHRTVGYGTLSRAEAAKVPESFAEIADDVRFRVDEVLALSPRGLVRTSTTLGVWRDGGGPFERTVCALDTFGADGRLTRHETFDAGREAEALARYEELTGGGDGSRPNCPANAATRLNERFVDAWARRDWDAVAALFDGTGQFEDRRRLMQMEGGRDLNLAALRVFLDTPGSRWTITPIATRGELYALSRMLLEGGVDADGGDFAIDYLAVDEVGPDGRSVDLVLFDLDDLDAARAELESRFHAGEGRVTEMSDEPKENEDE